MLMPLSYRIRTLADTFSGHLSGDARLDPSNTVLVAGRATPTLLVDGKVLNLDFAVPDEFTDTHAATATVFARMGDDFVRVTTSVRKEDGQRAIGTVLERSHPAYARLLSATPYVGYATIFGRQMMTHYDPMLSTGGEVIGARYVGLDVSGMRSITVPLRVGMTVGALCILGFVAFDWFARSLMPPMAQSAFFYFGIVMTLAMALASYALVERGVSRAMKHCAAAAGKIAAGDLSAQVPVNRRDDVGRLLQSINGISVGLTQVVGQVQSASDGILESSRQIASGTSDLSTRTQQQAAALEQTAAAMEQLSVTVSQNAVHAGDANALVAKASTLAKDGTEIVTEVSRSMAAVRANAKRIEAVVGLIDNMAFQSNILALNAAVEAARAGEHGRGFAVVATEVRGLAQQSAAAARDVKALIAASVDTVDTGCALVERSGDSTRHIADAIRDASMLMNEIAAASSEQSKGIDEVKRAVTLMDDATQQNAALVEESAAAAMSMEEQASGMRRMVSAFRIAT